jgi:hypothetical protein
MMFKHAGTTLFQSEQIVVNPSTIRHTHDGAMDILVWQLRYHIGISGYTIGNQKS